MDKRPPMSSGQKKVLGFIRGFIDLHHVAPTRQEIADHFGWSSANSAQHNLEALARKGWIALVRLGAGKSTARGIRVL